MKLYYYNKNNAEYKKATWGQIILSALGPTILIAMLSGFTVDQMVNVFTEKVPVVIRLDEKPLNELNLRKEIQRHNIRFEDIVVAQYKLESACGTSDIAIENNNLFGMKVARLRPTTAVGERRGHAYYESWEECVTDYALWQTQNAGKIRDSAEYLILLDAIYAEVPDYVKRLKNVK